MMVRHSTDLGRGLVVVRPVRGEVLVVVGSLDRAEVRDLSRALLHDRERRRLLRQQ
jgi:hypothetical protein